MEKQTLYNDTSMTSHSHTVQRELTLGGLRSTFLLRDSSNVFGQRERFRRLLVVVELLELCTPDSSSDSTSSRDDDCPLNSLVSTMSLQVYVNYSRFIIPVLCSVTGSPYYS